MDGNNLGEASVETSIERVPSLQSLRLVDCGNLEVLPPLGRLPNLELMQLRRVGVRRLDAGFLGIEEVENANNINEGEIARVTPFPKLKILVISNLYELEEWDGIERRVGEEDATTTSIFIIMPQLQQLQIANCPLLRALPDYVLAASLQDLKLIHCENLEVLPPLGRLPNLEFLELMHVGVRRLDVVFVGIEEVQNANNINEGDIARVTAFPKLKTLRIAYLSELEEWDGIERRVGEEDATTTSIFIMPQLQKLIIHGCRLLRALPDYVLAAPLQLLRILQCPNLSKRYGKEEKGEDWHKISHIPENQESGMVISDAEKRIPVVEMLKSGKVTGSISTNMANGESLITKRCPGNDILNFVRKEVDPNNVWAALETLPVTHETWDDLINVAVQFRLNKQWDPITLDVCTTFSSSIIKTETSIVQISIKWLVLQFGICQWILYKSSFQTDVMCYNLLIDAYGQKYLYKKAEETYVDLLQARCIPTEDTYALLIKAYCACGLLEKAEAAFVDMRKYGLPPSAIVYNAYIDGLMKAGNPQRAIDIFLRMKNDGCQPSTDTYTLLINLHGKACQSYMALKLFNEMRSKKCRPDICTYTALVNAFAREGLCEKAEEIFEQMQEDKLEPDVYTYNALMEAYSRAGFPYGAAEIFSLMRHMGCEPDRASYNIMVDAYGRAGLHEDAQAVFNEMKRLGITPTMKSHMLLLCAYSKARNVTKCEEIVNQMSESGLEPDTFVLNSMMHLYGQLGQFEKMEEVLTAMEKGPYEADISTYNILINIYGRPGFFERMEGILQSLTTKNLKPDVVTWTSRLGAYSRKKLYRKCLEIFEEMIDAGCHPDGGTAKVLLSACSSEDQIEQVTTVIRTMHKGMEIALPA
ncbi:PENTATRICOPEPTIDE REPEAT-CONTAINING PROTEIN [Salix purpurea]|uniref:PENTATRICOPEPTIDE REPEAT-CONTAINING PROTEIN n=1 Tax=Salix purpurea TaxID=77065 RepID=A0A9Q0VIF2_SALPP|nr:PENTATRICOPEPTIDE REPEAT-CONTAINING PROTEIN [Salix purpurea]